VVWNIKSQKERLVKLIPNDTWGGAGLLGVTIRLDNYQAAEERLIRVLVVSEKSPAAVAGLVPDTDFLLGTTTQTLDSVKTLAKLLQQHENTVLDLYVYNSKSDMVRMVALMPTVSWEASRGGLLGAELGTGYLHRLPKAVTETVGASVQRKVRYVGTKDAATEEGSSGNKNSNGGGDGKHTNGKAVSASSSTSSFTTVNMSPTDPSKGTALVEVEPQLEMEAHETESEDEDVAPHPVKRQHRKENVQSTAAARVAAAAAITGSSAGHSLNGSHSAAQLHELQQRMPPPPLEEVQILQPPLLPDQLRLSRSDSSDGGQYPAHVQWNRSSEEQQFQQPPMPSQQQLRMSRSGSSEGGYPANVSWNRSGHSRASSTDGESSIGNELPMRTATPVKMNRVEVVSPPSSNPGAFTSVNAIFSKPAPKGQPEAPIKSSSLAGYVKSTVPAAVLEQAAPMLSNSPLAGRAKSVVPETEFIRGTKPKSPLFPPPPMMHYVAQPSTNK
jgi:hypothetical protein